MRNLARRVRAWPPERRDLLLGAALLCEGLVEYAFAAPHPHPEVVLAQIAVMAAGLAARSRAPLAGAGAMLGGMLVGTVLAPELEVIGPFFATIFATWSVGYRVTGIRLIAATATGMGLAAGTILVDDFPDQGSNLIFTTVFLVLGPVVVGRVMRHRTQLNDALREKLAAADADRADRLAAAAVDERTRIAGELHDVVAHALGAMTVQATAAGRLIDRDPLRAAEALGTVESTGREALTELRRLLGVLRREDEDLALAPQPSLDHVAALARRAEAAGLPVTVSVGGTPGRLSAGIDLTAYRVVQEALRWARDEGRATHADVAISYGDGHVRLEIADDGDPDRRRPLGLRERVELYGGTLELARPAAGGRGVVAQLPMELVA